MARIMKMILMVDEEAVGGLIADLTGRVKGFAFETEELVDRRTKVKKEPKAKPQRIVKVGSVQDDIVNFLSRPAAMEVGATAAAITAALAVNPTSTFSSLYSLRDKGKVIQDGAKRWFIKQETT